MLKPGLRASNWLLGADSVEVFDLVLATASSASVSEPLAEKPVSVGSKQCPLLRNQKTATMKKERLNATTRATAATSAVRLWTMTARANCERSAKTEAGECEDDPYMHWCSNDHTTNIIAR